MVGLNKAADTVSNVVDVEYPISPIRTAQPLAFNHKKHVRSIRVGFHSVSEPALEIGPLMLSCGPFLVISRRLVMGFVEEGADQPSSPLRQLAVRPADTEAEPPVNGVLVQGQRRFAS